MRAGEDIPLFVHHYDQAQPGPPRPRAGVVPSRTSRRRRRGRAWASGHYDEDQPGLRLLDLASASSPAGPRADVGPHSCAAVSQVLAPAPPLARVSQMRGFDQRSTKKTHDHNTLID